MIEISNFEIFMSFVVKIVITVTPQNQKDRCGYFAMAKAFSARSLALV